MTNDERTSKVTMQLKVEIAHGTDSAIDNETCLVAARPIMGARVVWIPERVHADLRQEEIAGILTCL
jgi:hypothetical protein